ncbi:hypothetical protein [Altericista sp. CCNU0014]|uniref:hypothetical protein n=1 Tax=Altericista sp. CCNU0014 TaxID=3082949 RepID=UPI00384FA3B1
MLLTIAACGLSSFGLKAVAQSQESPTQIAVFNEPSFDDGIEGHPVRSVSTSATDLKFSLSELHPEQLDSLPSPHLSEGLAQGTVEPLPEEEVGQPPSLKTEPATPDDLPFQPKKELLQRSIRYGPSISYLTPSAYGKSWGQISVGGSIQHRIRFGSNSDAILGVGIGFGDARKAVGLDVSVGIADVSNFERVSVGFKLHRRLPDRLAIAVGVDNAIVGWGNIDAGISPYGVVTKGFQLREDPRSLFSQLYLSAGAGTGRYRSEDDVLNDRDSVGVFGSAALRITEQLSFITEWSGQDLTLAVSFLPFPRVPFVITPAVTDVAGTAGDGPRFSLGVGLGFTF